MGFPVTEAKSSGMITITFDDAVVGQFENAYPILRDRGVKGVAFVPTAFVDRWFEGEQSMSLSQLRELADAGWEIGSHSLSHPILAYGVETKLPLPAVEAELRESRDWLVAKGFPVISFAYPGGGYNDEVAAIARKYYRYARTCERGLNEVSSADTKLKRFNLCHRNFSQWKSAVDSARSRKKWLVAMVHAVGGSDNQVPPGREGLYISRDKFIECVEYALSSGLPIRTIQEIYETYRDFPEAAAVASYCAEQAPAGVEITVEVYGDRSSVAVRDRRRGFKLRFRPQCTGKNTVLSEISKRIAFDLGLSMDEIERLVKFDVQRSEW